jgi:hypothetical protein
MKLGERWASDPELRAVMHRFDAVIIGALLLALGWYLRSHWRHRLRPGDGGGM